LFDQTWNILEIGTVMLIGLVTKRNLNCRFANQLREQGKPKLEAILEASEADATYFNDRFSYFIGALQYVSLGAASTVELEWEL
jgi:HAE1 family hydrophobic/amphiphilic exporter-1/multidrug efflux pump